MKKGMDLKDKITCPHCRRRIKIDPGIFKLKPLPAGLTCVHCGQLIGIDDAIRAQRFRFAAHGPVAMLVPFGIKWLVGGSGTHRSPLARWKGNAARFRNVTKYWPAGRAR